MLSAPKSKDRENIETINMRLFLKLKQAIAKTITPNPAINQKLTLTQLTRAIPRQ